MPLSLSYLKIRLMGSFQNFGAQWACKAIWEFLRDGSAVLSCPTGFLLGVQSRHRTQALGLKGITSLASLDAYCFGHILYEVASC